MKRGSLRIRLLALGGVAIVLALSAAAFSLSLLFERHVERRVVAELGSDVDEVIAGVDLGAEGALDLVAPPADPLYRQPLSGHYWQVELPDRILRSRSLWDDQLETAAAATDADPALEYRMTGPRGAELVAVERRIILPQRLGGAEGRVVVAVDRAEILAATRAFRADLFPYLVIIGALLFMASFAQVTIGLRPLAAIRSKLTDVKLGRARRLGQGFPDEVRPLVREVDALLESSERAVEKARSRASDLAHALKTPLQVLSGDVERLRTVGQDTIAAEIGTIASTMRQVVNHELARARLATDNLPVATRIATMVDQVLAVLKRTPDGDRLDWIVAVDPSLLVRVDDDALAEAFGNVAENAARHAASQVSISAARIGDEVALVVADDGDGIDRELLKRVTGRGVRVDQTGPGAGLGLAIVADIVEAVGGGMMLENTMSGFAATLNLPAASDSSGPSGK